MDATVFLKDRFPMQECWIVGKGPSLANLRADYFGDGPVIAINEAILTVQEFGLPNPVFSMQKDGYESLMVKPNEDVTLILQTDLSEGWFTEHPKRIIMDPVSTWGFRVTEMSIRMCVALAKLMGCRCVSFLCCDSLSSDDYRMLDVRSGEIVSDGRSGFYGYVKPLVLKDVKDFPHRFILPGVHAA